MRSVWIAILLRDKRDKRDKRDTTTGRPGGRPLQLFYKDFIALCRMSVAKPFTAVRRGRRPRRPVKKHASGECVNRTVPSSAL